MRRENFGKTDFLSASANMSYANLNCISGTNNQTSPVPVPATSAQEFQPRGRTMNPPAAEERKGGRDGSESSDVSLTRIQQKSSGMKNYTVTDGEFTSFPEIMATSAQQMIARGYAGLFPIQQHSFYPIYNREDVIARDLTGSGKTLAFCLPTTEWLRKNRFLGSRRIQAIIMCPTRELAIQVSTGKFLTFLHYIDNFEAKYSSHFPLDFRFKMSFPNSSILPMSSNHSLCTEV